VVGSDSASAGNTIEYLTPNGWQLSPTTLPGRFSHTCAAVYNSSTYIIFQESIFTNLHFGRKLFGDIFILNFPDKSKNNRLG
jgi:hypothetical protein